MAPAVPLDGDASLLSGGQQQRVGHARSYLRALCAPRARFILFDEPTSALDEKLTIAFWAAVRKLAAKGMGVLVVTHDPQEVLEHYGDAKSVDSFLMNADGELSRRA